MTTIVDNVAQEYQRVKKRLEKNLARQELNPDLLNVVTLQEALAEDRAYLREVETTLRRHKRLDLIGLE